MISTGEYKTDPQFADAWMQSCLCAMRGARKTFNRTHASLATRSNNDSRLFDPWETEPCIGSDGNLLCSIGVLAAVRLKVSIGVIAQLLFSNCSKVSLQLEALASASRRTGLNLTHASLWASEAIAINNYLLSHSTMPENRLKYGKLVLRNFLMNSDITRLQNM